MQVKNGAFKINMQQASIISDGSLKKDSCINHLESEGPEPQ